MKQLQDEPSFIGVILVTLFILLTLLLCLYLDRIQIMKVDNLDDLALPQETRQFLIENEKFEPLFVRFDGDRILYHLITWNDFRAIIIIDALKKLTVSLRHNLPRGDYIFSTQDGLHTPMTLPIMAFAANKSLVDNKNMVLIPDHEALMYHTYKSAFKIVDKNVAKYPWKNKQPIIFWRGSSTGMAPDNDDMNATPRLRFLRYTQNISYVDAGFTHYTVQHNKDFLARLNVLYPIKNRVGIADSLSYKYLLDIDGNSCSYSRMAWILYSNSLLLKHESDNVQWYYGLLQPNVHYLAIHPDFSNLQSQYVWAEANQDAVQSMTVNAHQLAKQVFNMNSILSSLQAALLQYNEIYTEHLSSN